MVSPEGIKINNEFVAIEDIGTYLQKVHADLKVTDEARSKKLIIQADKDSDFGNLNPIVLAGTQSGFETIMFAALQMEESK